MAARNYGVTPWALYEAAMQVLLMRGFNEVPHWDAPGYHNT
jgi:hypothetical protein